MLKMAIKLYYYYIIMKQPSLRLTVAGLVNGEVHVGLHQLVQRSVLRTQRQSLLVYAMSKSGEIYETVNSYGLV